MSNFKEKIYAIVFGEHNTRSKDKSEQEVIDRVEETYRKEYDYFMVVHEFTDDEWKKLVIESEKANMSNLDTDHLYYIAREIYVSGCEAKEEQHND